MMKSPLLFPITVAGLYTVIIVVSLIWNLWVHTAFDAPIVPWGIIIIVAVLTAGMSLFIAYAAKAFPVRRRSHD